VSVDQPPYLAGATSSRPTVAIINDVPDIAAMLESLFVGQGCDVVSWSIGRTRSGEPCLQPGRPAAALVWDVSLPGTDSWRALELLGQASRPHPEIVLTTSNAGLLAPTARLIKAEGRIVQAPYDLDLLIAAVRAAISPSGTPYGVSRERGHDWPMRTRIAPLPPSLGALQTVARGSGHQGTSLEATHLRWLTVPSSRP